MSQVASSGGTFPASSCARQQRTYSPGSSAAHSNRQPRQPQRESSGSRSASPQISPPSVLISTRVTRTQPDQARPSNGQRPAGRNSSQETQPGIPVRSISA